MAVMCRVLGVSRAGLYAWERRAPCDRALQDAWLLEKVRAIHAKSKGTYGSRRVHAELRLAHDIRIGKKRVERLMAAHGLSGDPLRVRPRTTVRVPGVRVAPDLVERDFNPTEPDRTWSADITEIPTWGEAVPRARAGPLLPADRRVGDGRSHAQGVGDRRARDGRRAAPASVARTAYSPADNRLLRGPVEPGQSPLAINDRTS